MKYSGLALSNTTTVTVADSSIRVTRRASCSMESASSRFTGPFSKVTLQYDGETSSTMNCAEAVMASGSHRLAAFAPVKVTGGQGFGQGLQARDRTQGVALGRPSVEVRSVRIGESPRRRTS